MAGRIIGRVKRCSPSSLANVDKHGVVREVPRKIGGKKGKKARRQKLNCKSSARGLTREEKYMLAEGRKRAAGFRRSLAGKKPKRKARKKGYVFTAKRKAALKKAQAANRRKSSPRKKKAAKRSTRRKSGYVFTKKRKAALAKARRASAKSRRRR